MRLHHPLLLSAALLLGAPAAAGDAPVSPYLASDLSSDTRVGVQTLLGRFRAQSVFGQRDVTVTTVDLVGDIAVTPYLKLQARMPVVHFTDTQGDYGTGFGNFTAGARFVAGEDTRVGLGSSVSAPTASTEDNAGRAAEWGGRLRNLHDPGMYIASQKTVRVEGDVQHSFGQAFVLGQLGLHMLFFDEGRSSWFGGDQQQNLIRFTMGGGVRPIRQLAFWAEVTSFSDVLENNNNNNDQDNFDYVLDSGVQFESGAVATSLRVYVPLDEGQRTQGALGVGLNVMAHF